MDGKLVDRGILEVCSKRVIAVPKEGKGGEYREDQLDLFGVDMHGN